ncbi:MAG: PLP-dependent transferase [Comamonadaceae bacterium]|nr:PLP-dependent transferase [Comamonadaceae bacterium]
MPQSLLDEPVRHAGAAGRCDRRRRARCRWPCRSRRSARGARPDGAGAAMSERRAAKASRPPRSRATSGGIRSATSAPSTRRSSAPRRSCSRRWPTLEKRRRSGGPEDPRYGLHGMPTVTDLQDAVAALEGGHGGARRAVRARPRPRCRCSRSPRPATTCWSSIPSTGPRGASATCTCAASASTSRYYDPLLGAGIAARPAARRRRVVFAESPGSLTFEMQDIPAIAAVARARGATVVMDNTWATPLVLPRRSTTASTCRSTRRPSTSAGTRTCCIGLVAAQRGDVPGGCIALCDRHGRDRQSATTASWRCAACARCATRLAQHQASALEADRVAAAAARGRARCCYPALPGRPAATSCGSATSRGAIGLFGVRAEAGWPRRASHAMLDGMQLFGMRLESGAASRA